MASESTETVTVRLPSELDSWLDEQARELEVTRETVLVQMLASYRATAELEGDLDAAELEVGTPGEEEVAEMVDSRVDERLGEQLDARVEAAVDQRVGEAVEASLSEATEAVEARLKGRVDSVDREFHEKIEDVRERVIQVKQEADAKAPADHDHEEFERLVALGKQVDDLEEEVGHLTERLDATVPEQEAAVEELEADLDTVQERLRTVAWAVRDLRDSVEAETGLDAVERVKRAAAKADVDRARCENCGNGVDIALLTDPHCPHCEATVTDVEEASGFFSKPKLLVASQLESGENDE
jgi:predicted transcriptional regulator/prefoldin subunit 5